jgi:hypothetical protein
MTSDAIKPLRQRMIEDMSASALSATTQRHPLSQLTATPRQRCSPHHAVPVSRHRCCHAKPDPVASCACSPPRINSQNHRSFIVAVSQRRTPLRPKSPWRAAAKPSHPDHDFVPWRLSDASRQSPSGGVVMQASEKPVEQKCREKA